MSKKDLEKQTKSLNTKRIAIISVAAVLVVLVLVLILTLGGGKQVATITGSDDNYVTVGKHEVSKGELYDAMKSQGTSIFTNILNESLFSFQEVVFEDDNFAAKKLDETVNQSLYGTTDLEDIEEFYGGDDNEVARLRRINQFVDSLFLVNPKVDRNVLASFLDTNTSNYYKNEDLKNQYLLNVKQFLFAQDKLDSELAEQLEDDADAYYNSLLTNFKADSYVKYDLDLLVIRFINDAEARQYLRYFGLISDANGNWYQLPVLPSNADLTVFGFLLTDTVALTSANIDTTVDENHVAIRDAMKEIKNVDTFDTLYDYFKANDKIPNYFYNTLYSKMSSKLSLFQRLGDDQVLELFVGIEELLTDKVLTEDDYRITYEYDELTTKLGATLRNYAYNTITSLDNDDEEETKNPFSTLRSGSGTSRYLIFRFSDAHIYKDFFEDEDGDKTDLEIFKEQIVKDEFNDLLDELLTNLKETRLNSTYVSTKTAEYLEDLKLDIYDDTLRLFYSMNAEYTGTEKSNKEFVAKWSLGDLEGTLTADELYEKLEVIYGTNLSLDLIIKKSLLASNIYVITDEERDEFEKQYTTLLTNFAADAFASSGYPASIGREKFLKLVFEASTKEEAITNGYVLPRLKELFGTDYETHYGENIFAKLETLTNKQYDNYAGITVSHVLVYLDKDFDGTPEDPNEYFKENPGEQEAFELAVVELVNLINSEVLYKSDYVTGIQQIISEYESVGRAEIQSHTVYGNPLNQYTKFRKLGIGLKFENISSQITNSSNFLSSTSGRLDEVFYNRAIHIYNTEFKNNEDFDVDVYDFPYVDFLNDGLAVNDLEEIRSDFGYHIIVVGNTSGNSNVFAKKPSAKLEEKADELYNLVIGDETLNPLNLTSDKISESQIRYYLESLRHPDIEDNDGLPSVLQSAFTTFFNPVKTMYDNTYHQRVLFFQFVEGLGTMTFADSTKLANYIATKEINEKQFFNYLVDENNNFYDADFEALYGDWFEVLRAN